MQTESLSPLEKPRVQTDTTSGSLRIAGALRESLPLTGLLYPPGIETGRVPLPQLDNVNQFAETYLQPLGATSMRVEQVQGGILSAEELVDNFARGVIPVATDPEYFTHDICDHLVGALTLPEETTRIFRQVASLSKGMRETNPDAAQVLDVALAHIFDERTDASARFLKGVKGWSEEPLLLTQLNSFLANSRKFTNNTSELIEINKAAIESAIDDVPPEESVTYEADTKVGRWAEWEARHMPAYAASIKEVLLKKPRSSRVLKITHLLGMRR